MWHLTHEEHLPLGAMVIIQHCAPPSPRSLRYAELLRSSHQLQRKSRRIRNIHKIDEPYRRFVTIYPEAVFVDVERCVIRRSTGMCQWEGSQVSGVGFQTSLRGSDGDWRETSYLGRVVRGRALKLSARVWRRRELGKLLG